MIWQLDSAHSSIQFTVRHMMFSKVRGVFSAFSVDFNYDIHAPTNSALRSVVEMASLTTGDRQRDEFLRSPDFFAVADYPTAVFESTAVKEMGRDRGRLTGKLTIRDVTNAIACDVRLLGTARSPWGTTVAAFTAVSTLDRHDWGLNWSQVLETGGFLVGDKVELKIKLQFVEIDQKN